MSFFSCASMSSTDCSDLLGGGGGGVDFGGGLRAEDDEAALDDAVLLRLASELEELVLFPDAPREVGRVEKPSSSFVCHASSLHQYQSSGEIFLPPVFFRCLR